MKKLLVSLAGLLVAVPLVFTAIEVVNAQRADYGWRPPRTTPTFREPRPVVVIDEAHNNASTAQWSGRYWPLARLLRADGYTVRRGRAPFTRASLDGVRVLIVANASGAPKPQALGINMPVRTAKDRGDAAFTPAEIEAVKEWVASGGALLLVADHAPFGVASSAMGRAFGVTMHGGFTEVPNEPSDPLVFSRSNGRLGDHAILRGSSPSSGVRRVATFTGQSLDAPPDASALLRLPNSAVEWVQADTGFVAQRAGCAQCVALAFGAGRVVVMGEAAALTAQVNRRQRFGMNLPDNDNRQFALNVMHWLSRAL